jgi:hypothetical protein
MVTPGPPDLMTPEGMVGNITQPHLTGSTHSLAPHVSFRTEDRFSWTFFSLKCLVVVRLLKTELRREKFRQGIIPRLYNLNILVQVRDFWDHIGLDLSYGRWLYDDSGLVNKVSHRLLNDSGSHQLSRRGVGARLRQY